jgi:hypothetical protein
LVEHVKSFIESTCWTVLQEFGESMPSSNPSTTELLVFALRPLGLQNSRGASKLDKVLSGYNRLSDALSEMRNEIGPVAHGRDGFLDALAADHARAFLYTGDAILGLLLHTLEGKEPDLLSTREPYERFPHLHERIDRSVAILDATVDLDSDRPVVALSLTSGGKEEAIIIRVEPSRLLYGLDRPAYVEVLNTAAVVEPLVGEEEEPELPEARPVRVLGSAPSVELSEVYEGRLASLRSELEDFLRSEAWSGTETYNGDANLISSLLDTVDRNMGLDWKNREPLLARLKVACQRVLVSFAFDKEIARGVSERLVEWLRIHAPDDGEDS